MTFDIIIVSDAYNNSNKTVTEECVKSLLLNKLDAVEQKIIVVEKQETVNYENTLTLHYDFDFNYNKCLNYGLQESNAEFICLANNDLIFHKDWQAGIIIGFSYGVGSLSPYCIRHHKNMFQMDSKIHTGYRTEHELAGWCICLTRETLNSIGKLNEAVSFWYSDNIYAEQLKRENIKHGIVCNSFVTHLLSHTLNQRRPKDKHFLTREQKEKFNNEVIKLWNNG